MADPTDTVQQLTDTVVSEAALPRKSESDGQSAEGRPLTEIIEAAKFVSANATPRKKTIRLIRVTPPGAV